MKNPLNNSVKIFRWYIWVPYSAAFVCTNTEQQYHQCETNTIDTWTQIQSISRYNDHGVRGTIGLSIFLGDQEPQPPVKSSHSSICVRVCVRAHIFVCERADTPVWRYRLVGALLFSIQKYQNLKDWHYVLTFQTTYLT